ncbi:c-type cytochrome [Nitrolancea hollandica]|uniref:Putative monoheme Cytochrome c n=1 Tax=Nitrolancea hollandica Lb TaxID=1129897 RepID=I4EDZ9_9BACT|nr:cytochrome c [Nitrolancea hollandica]CCF82911.1 putative monoheme Cytochrome c [Nitrolancea hollandica Lb]
MMNTKLRWLIARGVILGASAFVLLLAGCSLNTPPSTTAPGESSVSPAAVTTTSPSPVVSGPPGSAGAGQAVYAGICSSCHGANLEGVGSYPPLVGRPSVPDFPSTQVLYDYIKRSMPYNKPGSLTDDQVYSVVAYLLSKNDLLPDNTVINAQTLPSIKLPGRDRIAPPLPGAPSTPQTVVPGSSQAAPTIGP